MPDFKLVPQIVRPRVWSGTDWGEKIRVLVKRGDKELWWHPAHVAYINRGSPVLSCKAELRICSGVEKMISGHNGIGNEVKTIATGGKLCAAMILAQRKTLAHFFGEEFDDALCSLRLDVVSRKFPKDRQTILIVDR